MESFSPLVSRVRDASARNDTHGATCASATPALPIRYHVAHKRPWLTPPPIGSHSHKENP